MGCVVGETVSGALVPDVDVPCSGPAGIGLPMIVAVARVGVDLVAEDTTNPNPTTRNPAAVAVRIVVPRRPTRIPLITKPLPRCYQPVPHSTLWPELALLGESVLGPAFFRHVAGWSLGQVTARLLV
jgi:hypothetical protein